MILDRDRGGTYKSERLRGRHLRTTGQVDRANQRPVGGIVNRRSRAAPRLDDPGIVFRSADLDLLVNGQRGTRRIGSGTALTPIRAGHEIHRLGATARCLVAFHPQQRAVRCGDGDYHPGPGRILDEQAADHGKCRRQWMSFSDTVHIVRSCLQRNAIRVHAAGKAAHPALRHHRAQRCRSEVRRVHDPGDEPFVHGAQVSCQAALVGRSRFGHGHAPRALQRRACRHDSRTVSVGAGPFAQAARTLVSSSWATAARE